MKVVTLYRVTLLFNII